MDLMFGSPTHNQQLQYWHHSCLVPWNVFSCRFILHHMLTIPINYTQLSGGYQVLTGAAKGTTVFGQDPLWLAWVTDLVNLRRKLILANTNTCFMPTHQLVSKLVKWWDPFGILMGIVVALPTAMWIQIKRKIQRDAFATRPLQHSWQV